MTDVSERSKWIAVDLDKTLAFYESGDYDCFGPLHIGSPIPMMVNRVKQWLLVGKTVKIFTARVAPPLDVDLGILTLAIEDWTEKYLGQRLEVTCVKDRDCESIWDDRAIHVLPNQGLTEAEERNFWFQYREDVFTGKKDIFGNLLPQDEE